MVTGEGEWDELPGRQGFGHRWFSFPLPLFRRKNKLARASRLFSIFCLVLLPLASACGLRSAEGPAGGPGISLTSGQLSWESGRFLLPELLLSPWASAALPGSGVPWLHQEGWD